jgi:hypothetical protein
MDLVTHFFLTPRFLVKGRVRTGESRLSTFLNSFTRPFLGVEDVTLLDVARPERTSVKTLELRVEDVVLAHEFLDLAGDQHQRALARMQEESREVHTFYLREPTGCELFGRVRGDVLATALQGGFCVVTDAEIRGLEEAVGAEFEKIRKLPYAILNTAYVHCHFRYE